MMTPCQLTDELDARLDGPHADEHTTAAADLAAAAIRFLNYATGSHSAQGLTYPSTAYEITASLATAAYRIPQIASQLIDWLGTQCAAGMLGMDDRSDPLPAVETAAVHLDTAAVRAGQLAHELRAAQEAIAALNGRGLNRPGGAR